MEKAESMQVRQIDLAKIHSGSSDAYAANLCRYISRKNLFGNLSNVSVQLPSPAQVAKHNVQLEVVSDDTQALDAAENYIRSAVAKLQPAKLTTADVDPLLVKLVQAGNSKKAKAVKQLQESNKNVELVYPKEGSTGAVILVWTDDSESELDGEHACILCSTQRLNFWSNSFQEGIRRTDL